jgi:hypothetical protein
MDGAREAPIAPREAEQVVQDRIEQFGLGALPEVEVVALADGMWRVRWDEFERIVAPMDLVAWQRWLYEHVGPLDAQALQTTES